MAESFVGVDLETVTPVNDFTEDVLLNDFDDKDFNGTGLGVTMVVTDFAEVLGEDTLEDSDDVTVDMSPEEAVHVTAGNNAEVRINGEGELAVKHCDCEGTGFETLSWKDKRKFN